MDRLCRSLCFTPCNVNSLDMIKLCWLLEGQGILELVTDETPGMFANKSLLACHHKFVRVAVLDTCALSELACGPEFELLMDRAARGEVYENHEEVSDW